MAWPCPQDYNEAIQSPTVAFTDEELRGAIPELNRFELPRAISGGFASVYRMHSPLGDVAVRCFLREVKDLGERYKHIQEFINGCGLPYLAKVDYLPEGICVMGRRFPVLKMRWLDGETLEQYIWRNLANRDALKSLCEKFEQLVADLGAAQIAHGDLQHGNVLVVDNELVLVDYDGMYVPALEGCSGNELGHRNYQHPLRCAADFGASLDHFAARSILSSLHAVAEDPTLWEKLGGGDECLLFKDVDYKLPLLSRSFYMLEKHESEIVRFHASQLRSTLDCKPHEVPAHNIIIDTSALTDIDAYTGFSGFWNADGESDKQTADAASKEHPSLRHADFIATPSKPPAAPASGENSFDVLLNQGIYQSEVGNYLQASRYFIRALQINPDSFDAYRSLGFAHLETGQAGIAVSNFGAALRFNPADAISFAGRSLAHLHVKRFGVAQSDAERSLAIEARNPLALRARATIRADLNQYQTALQDIESALMIAPRDAQCYCARGLIRQKMGRHAPAIADFDAALQLKPSLGKAYYGRAISQRELGKNSLAMEDLSMATRLMPSDADCHYAYGEVLLSLRHYEKAIDAFNGGLLLDQSNPQRAWLGLAQVNWSRGHYGEAGTLLRRVAERDQSLLTKLDPAVVNTARGFRYMEDGGLDGALVVFDGIIHGRFPLSEAYLGRGITLYRLGRYKQALEDFEVLSKSEKLGQVAICWMAICKTRLFELQEALSCIKSVTEDLVTLPLFSYACGLLQIFTEQFAKALKSMQSCESFEDASYWLMVADAMVAFSSKNHKQAVRLLERSLDEKMESIAVAALSEVLIDLKRFKDAERCLHNHLSKSKDICPQVHYWRGICLLKSRKTIEAQAEFERALAICDHYERALQAQQALVSVGS
jgi:tetratricopeptide (TPR) repeat protein